MNGDLSQGGDGIISERSGQRQHHLQQRHSTAAAASTWTAFKTPASRTTSSTTTTPAASRSTKSTAPSGSTGNVVVNNTIHIAANGRWALNIKDGSTGNTAYNNILVSEHPTYGAIDLSADSLTDFKSDYNVVISKFSFDDSFISLAQWRSQTGQDAHSIAAEPEALFENWTSGDYELLANAVARDFGTSTLAPLVDITGKSRPIGAKIDVGAYEFGLAPLLGDFNHDGKVNAADYTVWRNGLRSIYTAADYNNWKSHFGESNGAGSGAIGSTGANAAVPEPRAIQFLLMASGWLLCFVRKLYNRNRRGSTTVCQLARSGGGHHESAVPCISSDAVVVGGRCQ